MSDLFAALPADEASGRVGLWTRRAMLTGFAAVVALALAGVFGQRESTSVDVAPGATLRLDAPEVVRGGLLFQSRIDVRTRRAIRLPRLVLADGWTRGMQINSIEPEPQSESSRDGSLVLSFDRLAAGDRLQLYLSFQVNPTALSRRSYAVELDDARVPVARIDRTLTVLP